MAEPNLLRRARENGEADEAFSHTRPTEDPPWLVSYTEPRHLAFSGSVLWELGMHGQYITETHHRLTRAATTRVDARGRTRSQLQRAQLIMVTGDPIEAVALGTQALDWTGPLRSGKVIDEFRDLNRLAEPHANLPEGERSGSVAGVARAYPASADSVCGEQRSHRPGTCHCRGAQGLGHPLRRRTDARGRDRREAVTAQLRYCAELLNAHCPKSLRGELHTAVGSFAETAGYMAYDDFAYDGAERAFQFALSCAEAAGDWHLRVQVLCSLAEQTS